MSDLPNLRADSFGGQTRCSKCGGIEFKTDRGTGPVFGCKSMGSPVHFGMSEGDKPAKPVTCTGCGAEHAARYDYPEVMREPRQIGS